MLMTTWLDIGALLVALSLLAGCVWVVFGGRPPRL